MILLISPQDTLVEACAAMLPTSIPLVHLAAIPETESYLNAQTDDAPEPALILLDIEAGYEAIAECRQLYQKSLATEPPLVVLISNPANRQKVLEAGADDYLLLPLLPSEIYSWLADYLFAAFCNFQPVLETVQRINRSAVSLSLNQGLKNLAQIFNAPSAWLFLLNPDQKTFNLAGGYNLPPLLHQKNNFTGQELPDCLELVRQDSAPQLVACPYLARAKRRKTNGLACHLSLPLYRQGQFIGVLNLAYAVPPTIGPPDKRVLLLLGREIGALLETVRQQEETQFYATRTAFMVLLARTVAENLDLNTVLSLTLEQTVSLLGASEGDIWLLSANGQWLDQTSSLSSPWPDFRAARRLPRRRAGQGLIGWVVKHNRPLYTNAPTDDPRFDPQVDQVETLVKRSLLAAPLRNRETVIGVMVIYYNYGQPFTNRDTMLLEGVASLTASTIANARLLQELRDYGDRQRILYEMSQQIAAGLDLPATLKRSLYWIGRLFEVEAGFLWLVKEDADVLYLAAALGVDLPPGPPLEQPFKQGINGWTAHSGEAIIVNDPANEPRLDKTVFDTLQIALRNVMIAPMTYHNQLIGVLNLVNKIGEPFEQADLTLLCTAIEMVAVAVSNATLHTRAITLMNERERLHRQILQSERLATMGRLTATLSHEINNPMQVIQSALALALEELDNPEEVAAYLQMCQTESARVVRLLNRMRRVYRPQESRLVSLDLNQALQEAIALARKELKRQKVKLQTDLAPNLPHLTAVVDQLHLVFLSLLLNWSDAIGAAGGGNLRIRSYALARVIQIEFSSDASSFISNDVAFTGTDSRPYDLDLGMFLSQDIIAACNGSIKVEQQAGQTVCLIQLPVGSQPQ
ncbi:MAG: GAF domain-containing protein [Anaerolineae bacterium]